MIQVHGVPMIAQTRTWACWYACARMLIQWKRMRSKSTLAEHPSPSEVPRLERLHAANPGLSYGEVLTLAQLLGLLTVPPMSVTIHGIEDLLRHHGPLWTHGQSHVVVLTGADPQRDRVFVHDPAPLNVGRKQWRSYSKWFIHGNKSDSRGTVPEVQASFLFHP
jgi:ABC-type bacteriocin/lantibiotic exporter with double-glycine peptidase domain